MEGGWLSDNKGRINNISLAPNAKNALFPLFEGIMNSIHAIEERHGRDNLSNGNIEIEILRDEANEIVGFTIVDDGAGFNKDNVISFRKFDSTHKAKIGGKGVGRLLWLKVSDGAKISSQFYTEGEGFQAVEFDFSIENPVDNYRAIKPDGDRYRTSVTISPFRSEFATKLPKKADTIANRIIAHFVSYFTNMAHPGLLLIDGEEKVDLFDAFSDKVERDGDYKFIIDGIDAEFTIHCFLLPKAISDDEKSVNALYLGANGRAVSRHELDSVLGLKAINSQYAFFGYVESDYLNEHANDTRTAFSLDDDDIASIIDIAKAKAKLFLKPEIKVIREKQIKRIVEIGKEHPRFFHEAKDAGNVAESLHLSKQSEEEIFIELSRESLRTYKRRRRSYQESKTKSLSDVKNQTDAFVDKLQDDAIASLAEYVSRRKAIIEIFESGLKFTDVDKLKSHYEKFVHEVVCPMNSTTEELTYEDHNLWLIDDRLAFYTYFNSDIPMQSQADTGGKDLKRPDVTLFDLGVGFNSDDQGQPITIIEFKRPKLDNYTLEKNPISQARDYVDRLRLAGEATKFDGTPLRTIEDDTPFTCHIVADITPSLRAVMKQLGQFSQRAGSSSYYWWDSNYKTFIEISSFKEILSSAKARSEAFFEKLGIN